MQFNFDIEYKKAKENNVAESLSRLPMGKVSAVHVSTTGEALYKSIEKSLKGVSTTNIPSSLDSSKEMIGW